MVVQLSDLSYAGNLHDDWKCYYNDWIVALYYMIESATIATIIFLWVNLRKISNKLPAIEGQCQFEKCPEKWRRTLPMWQIISIKKSIYYYTQLAKDCYRSMIGVQYRTRTPIGLLANHDIGINVSCCWPSFAIAIVLNDILSKSPFTLSREAKTQNTIDSDRFFLTQIFYQKDFYARGRYPHAPDTFWLKLEPTGSCV